MAEYNSNAVQTVAPGGTILFTNAVEDCKSGLINWISGTGVFNVKGIASNASRCCCCSPKTTSYFVDFGANIAIADGGTAGPISVAISVNGGELQPTTMIVTPAAVGNYFNVSRASNIPVMTGCCSTISVINTSTQAITVQNANIVFNKKS